MEFKNEIYWLFDQTRENLHELRKYAKRAKLWIKENGENFLSGSDPSPHSTYSSHESDYIEEEDEKSESESAFEPDMSEPDTFRSERRGRSHCLLEVPN